MSIFLRQLWKSKPKQWGPASAVSLSIAQNLENIYGINPVCLRFVDPLWSPTFYDYASMVRTVNTNTVFKRGSADFNGTDAHIDIPSLQFLPPLTVLTRIKRRSTDGDYNGIITSVNSSAPYGGFGLWSMSSGRYRANAEDSYLDDVQTTTAYGQGTEISLAQCATTTDYAIYVDGQKASTTKTIGTVYTPSNLDTSRLGRSVAANELFDGEMHYALVFDTDLKPSQITHVHDNPYGLYAKVPERTYFVPAADGGGIIENINLASETELIISESLSDNLTENINFQSEASIFISESVSDNLVENINFSSETSLVISDTISANLLENIDLSSETSLSIAEIVSDNIFEDINLTAEASIVIADIISNNIIENIILAGEVSLLISDTVTGGITENINLSANTELTISDIIGGNIREEITLGTDVSLIISETVSNNIAEDISLAAGTAISISDLISANILENIDLASETNLLISEDITANILESISLAAECELTITESITSGITISGCFKLVETDLTKFKMVDVTPKFRIQTCG